MSGTGGGRGARVALAGAIGLAALVVVWEVAVRRLGVQPFILQAPSRIVAELGDRPGTYLGEAVVTARHAGLGLLAGLAVALVLGSILASSRLAEDAVQPILIVVLVTPWVSYFVSLVIWLGPGARPVVFLVAFVTAPVLTFATTAGLRSADPAARDLFTSVDARWWEVMWRLRLPSALPTLFATSRFAVALALAAAYFGEGGNLRNAGLGNLGRVAANRNLADQLWATIAATALLGIVLLTLVTVVERIVLRWHPSQAPRPPI